MLTIPPPTSNIERQRQFRQRNPGYYNKYYARIKAMQKSARDAAQAAAIAANAVNVATPSKPQPLMLPAPVHDPAMAALEALAASLKAGSAHDPSLVPLPAQPNAA
jgi:hypothetical protein